MPRHPAPNAPAKGHLRLDRFRHDVLGQLPEGCPPAAPYGPDPRNVVLLLPLPRQGRRQWPGRPRLMVGRMHAPLAAVDCPNCEISDSADPFFVRDPADGTLVCTVTRCRVCGYLQIV
jgi:hypothetical protein